MAEIRLSAYEDVLVIHFETESSRINAYTLATTLANVADAAKAANTDLNPGYEVEVFVEALGAGSFKATVRTVFEGAGNLFSKENLKTILLAVVASYIYQVTLAPSQEIQVDVGTDEVVVEHGRDRVVIPREVYHATEDAKRNKRFTNSIGKAMECVAEDDEISHIGFTPNPQDKHPELPIPRERLAPLYIETTEEPDYREIVEVADLQIVRAILERSKRRWQFVWDGFKISAPVTDGDFYDAFFARSITIAPGDSLRVRLRIRQNLDQDLGIYVNENYEVFEVLDHIPRNDTNGNQLDALDSSDT